VPLIVFVAVLLPIQSDVMFTPGAWMSTHGPQFEKEAKKSLLAVAATVIAVGALAGEAVHASA
jgi:hypothetical protein